MNLAGARSGGFFVYMMANRDRDVWVGFTSGLHRRVLDHKELLVPGFSAKYDLNRLVYVEPAKDIFQALARERLLKNMAYSRKIEIIEQHNPEWRDLSDDWRKVEDR